MKIRPLHDYVIIRRKVEAQLSTGGIVIPDTATEKPVRGEVVAVGNGRILKSGRIIPLVVRPGDQVVFGKFSGTEIKLESDELLVMREADILAVVEK
jgi:chaperonin GroES